MMKSLTFILPSLLLTSGLALGSDGSGGNYSFGHPDYNTGKQVFFKKLYCSTCPLSDLTLDRESVAAIMPSLESDGDLGKSLDRRERDAVDFFLKKRFNL